MRDGMWRVHIGGLGRTTSPVLVVYGAVGGFVHLDPVHAMSDPTRVSMWRFIYQVKIENLLEDLGAEVTTHNINLVAELMKDVLLDSAGKGTL